jgi:hypothetical protein
MSKPRSKLSSYLHSEFMMQLACFLLLTAAVFAGNLIAQQGERAPAQPNGGWVVIPVEEYQSLRARAFPADQPPEPPPVDATLTRVDYDLRVNAPGGLATGHANLTIDVIKDGWVRVAIPPGLLVREARMDGKPVSLVPAASGKSGHLSAVLSHAGRAVLMLDIALPVNASSGEETLALPPTSSGVTRAALQVPKQDMDVKLSGGLLAEKSESGNESKWLVYGRGNEPITVTWKRKLEDHRLTQPLRMRGTLHQLLGLGEDTTSVYADVNLEILQGAAKEAVVQVPPQVTINQVSGALVSDWKTSDGRLIVTFLEPVEQNARFTIAGETRTPREGQVEVPLLRLANVERDSGGVAVEVLGAGEIKDHKAQGLESADPSELGEIVAGRQSASMEAFRYRAAIGNTARSLSVDVARYAQQAVLMANIDEARYQVLLSKEGKTLVQARYAVRNNQRDFLKLTLPQNAAIWSAAINGRPVRPGQSPDGGLLLPLEKSRAGEDAPAFAVEVLYLVRETGWQDKGKTILALPAVDLPVSRSGVLLFHPPQYRVSTEPGPFRKEEYQDPASPVLNAGGYGSVIGGININGPRAADQEAKDKTLQLIQKYGSTTGGGRTARVLPAKISFPEFGPSLFLVSELTAEKHVPTIEISFQREKKDGEK